MKLVNYLVGTAYETGIVTDRGIVSLRQLARVSAQSDIPLTTSEIIRQGEAAVEQLEQLVALAKQPMVTVDWLQEEEAVFGPCVPEPGKIICIGLNYRKHAEETQSPIPSHPVVFSKFTNTVTSHQAEIVIPDETEQVDYEAELVIVIGKEAKHINPSDALQYVFGYCNANDISARDLQNRTSQWILGKSCDGFAPIGPYLVTADEVGDPNQLAIRGTVNGEVRQLSNTQDMIFSCQEIIAYLSKHMTLYPGDIILTGTPEGVIVGYPPDERVWLKAGDELTVEIDKLGVLKNVMRKASSR